MTWDKKPETTPLELGLNGIVELAIGYQRAQILFAANGLDIFKALSSGPKTAEQVARELNTETRGVAALLDACVGLKILRLSEKGYENSITARLFLMPGSEISFSPVLTFWQRFSYGVWGRLEEAVRHNQPQTPTGPKPKDLFGQLLEDPDQLRLFFDGLAGLAYWPARKIAEVVDFDQRHHLLDLGGGSGAFSVAIAKRHPHLQVTLFDLEPVCALARERFAQGGLNGRLTTVSGDFFHDPLPTGVDCVLLANVLHDWSAEECAVLLNKIHTALAPGGEIIIYDVVPEENPPEASLFSLALVLDTNRGRVYRIEEFKNLLDASGFRDPKRHAITESTSLVTAVKGSGEKWTS